MRKPESSTLKYTWGATALLLTAMSVMGQSSPTVTRVEDILYNANGSTVEGAAEISWKQFTAVDGSTIANSKITVQIVQGILTVDLTPNEGATPVGTSYRVDYTLDNGNQYTETWVVPASPEPLPVSTVRVGLPPQLNGTISQSQVEGLVAALQSKPDVDTENIFTQPQKLRESFDGQTLLGFEKAAGDEGVYFKLPTLADSTTYTLPVADGLPNQQLTTDGTGRLFWAAVGAGAGGSALEVVQNNGFSLTQRNVINFSNGLTAFDDAQGTRTTIQPLYGFSAGTITQGNDIRLSNARTPLAHVSTHHAGGSDPISPTLIGAVQRNNDFMISADGSKAVLMLQGAANQSAALQEWRNGNGQLVASVTPGGSGFFREFGLAAQLGQTTATQFFQIDGLSRFGFSSTSGALDVVRYDNSGLFKDRVFRVFRNGGVDVNATFSVGDPAVSSLRTTLSGPWIDLPATANPAGPAAGAARLFLDSASGELSVRKSSGTVVSLESGGSGGGGGGGGSGGSFGQFIDNETPAGAVNGSNATFTLAFAPDPVESLDLTKNGIGQLQGVDYNLAGQTITFLAGSIPQSGNVLRASYRVGASQASGDLSGDYPNPTVSAIQGRFVSPNAPFTGECLAWNDITSFWEPGPCAVVTDQLVWTFSGTPALGVQPLTLTIPEGVVAVTLRAARIVTATTGSTPTSYNIERCTANCSTSAATFSPIFSTAPTLGPTLRTDVSDAPTTVTVAPGDQFRVRFNAVGNGVSNLTIALTFEHQAYAALEGQSPLNCISYCAELWDAAQLEELPFGPPRRVGDACVCFGPELPQRIG